MNIAIDLTPLYNRKWTGLELYAIDLYRALLTTKHKIIPIFNVQNQLDNNIDACVINANNRLLLENLILSKTIRKINAHIVLFPIFPPPIDIYFYCNSKIIPTIHDTAFFNYPFTLNLSARYYLVPKYKLALKYADKLITISETVKEQLQQHTNRSIVNLGENISMQFKDASEKANFSFLDKWNLKPCEYIISVSTIEPRKNIEYLLDVFADYILKSNLKLVLVGRKGWNKKKRLKTLTRKYGYNIIFTDFVDINELISLYHYAKAFALLSLDEGFGRTPLEAIACGCEKIIVSDIEIFHEVLGGSANYLPLNNVDICKRMISNFDAFTDVDKSFQLPFCIIEDRLSNPELLKNLFTE